MSVTDDNQQRNKTDGRFIIRNLQDFNFHFFMTGMECHLVRILYGATTKPNPDIASWDAEHLEMANSGTRKDVSDGVTEEKREMIKML